jgi:plasmid stability protein
MKARGSKQYTIRGVPEALDRVLRERARKTGKSLNEAALDALRRGAGVETSPKFYTDLDHLIGKWEDDPQFERAIADQDVVDEASWR